MTKNVDVLLMTNLWMCLNFYSLDFNSSVYFLSKEVYWKIFASGLSISVCMYNANKWQEFLDLESTRFGLIPSKLMIIFLPTTNRNSPSARMGEWPFIHFKYTIDTVVEFLKYLKNHHCQIYSDTGNSNFFIERPQNFSS